MSLISPVHKGSIIIIVPYDYTVEVTNRFKGLDLIDRVPEELWKELVHYIGGSDQNHPKEKEIQKDKMVV